MYWIAGLNTKPVPHGPFCRNCGKPFVECGEPQQHCLKCRPPEPTKKQAVIAEANKWGLIYSDNLDRLYDLWRAAEAKADCIHTVSDDQRFRTWLNRTIEKWIPVMV